MAFDRSVRIVFDEAAGDYDEARPGYPEELVEDVISLSSIPLDGCILEVGCGPGKATLLFAQRGYAMLCLELGAALAALAARNCQPYPRVRVQHTSFEDWSLQPGAFDLFISAQAFHWIPPEIGYTKAAAALKPMGWMALFWNDYPEPDTPFFQALAEVYRARAPELDRSARLSLEELFFIRREAIEASGFFGDVMVKRYPWSETYTTERYLKLMNTYSDHRSLDEDTRRVLFHAVHELIEEQGGIVERPYLSALYMARVK